MADASNGGALEVVYDGETPRTFTGRARTVISGGQFVVVSGAANVIGSRIDSFNPGSIVVDLLQNSDFANGIALNTVGSNGLVTVATRGTYIACGGDAISGGAAVYPVSGTVQYVAAVPITAYSGGQTTVGRAITAADSGTNHYLLVGFSF